MDFNGWVSMKRYILTEADPLKSAQAAAEERYPRTHAGQLASQTLVGPDRIFARYELGNLGSQSLEVSRDTYGPGGTTIKHAHPEREQAYYVLAGTAVIHVGSEEKVVGPGSAALIPAGMEHSFRNIGKSPLTLLVISSYLPYAARREP